MEKQTKQIIALIVLIVVAGGVAVFWTMGGEESDGGGEKKNAADTVAATPSDAGAKPAGTVPANPVPTGAPGAKPVVVAEQDLEMPEVTKIVAPSYTWKWLAPDGGEGAKYNSATGSFPPFDPLYVQNIDVVDPERKKYIEELKSSWIIDGITVTKQKRPVLDATGKQLRGESILEPKPLLQQVPRRNKAGEVMFDETDKVIMEYVIKLDPELDSSGNPKVNANGDPVYKQISLLDHKGNEMKDDAGNVITVDKPIYEQATDELGNPRWGDNGEPVWVMQPRYLFQAKGRDGQPAYDSKGQPIWVKQLPYIQQATDTDGNPRVDSKGQPVWILRPDYDTGFRVVKQVPLIVRRQKTEMIDGKEEPVFDDDGKPAYEQKQAVERDIKGAVIKDADGNPIPVMVPDEELQFEIRLVTEVWFKDQRRPYREKDRLTNTRFIIAKIFLNQKFEEEDGSFRIRAGVHLLGDTGANFPLFLSDDVRYEVKDLTKDK